MDSDLSEKILEIIIDKYPNLVAKPIIFSRLPEYKTEEVKNELDNLVGLNQLTQEIENREPVGLVNEYYQIAGDAQYPIRRNIKFGDHSIPRILKISGPKYFPENFNEAVELLAAHSDSMVKNYEKKIEELKTDFWSKIFTTFATFISILALILTGIPKIQIQSNWSYYQIFMNNSAQLLPIFIFAAALIMVTRHITKKP